MQVNCNSCKQDFNIALNSRRLPGDGAIDLLYFVCPHCSNEYAGGYTNTEIRSKQQAVARLKEKLGRIKDLTKVELFELQIKTIQAEIAAEMDALKASFNTDTNIE